MQLSVQHGYRGEEAARERSITQKAVGAGSLAGTIAGIGAIVLAIVGLAGVFPGFFMSISTIVVGGAFLFLGGAIAARWRLLTTPETGATESAVVGGGMSTEFVAGIIAVVLGIISLAGVVPAALVSVGAIVVGGALVLSTNSLARMSALLFFRSEETSVADARHEEINAAASVQILFGIAAIALGIAALAGVFPIALNLVAMLLLGICAMLNSSSIGGMLVRMFGR